MTDIDRFTTWMAAKGLTMKQLAREMGLSYITVYHILVKRGQRSGRISHNFQIRFIKVYGLDEAVKLFSDLMAEPA